MALLRSLPENATLVDLRRIYADLLEKLRPYGHRLMRGPSPLTCGQREQMQRMFPALIVVDTVMGRIRWSLRRSASTNRC